MILKTLKDCKKIKHGDSYVIQEVLDLVNKGPEFIEQAKTVEARYKKEIDKNLLPSKKKNAV